MSAELKSFLLLEVSSDTVQVIRKYYGLDDPGKMEETVAILEEWIQKQKHFKKKDFNRNFLEMTIIQCKGSVERAKSRLDKYCTLRTMLPRFFDKTDARREFQDLHQLFDIVVLPNLTGDHNRVGIVKPLDSKNVSAAIFLDFYKYTFIIVEYLKAHDCFNGAIVIFDYQDINVGEFISVLNPIDMGEAIKLYTECFGLRLKGFHFITPSKMIQGLVAMMKQFLSQKLAERIHIHKNVESLVEFVPKEVLPEEYGGNNRKSRLALKDDLIDLLASEEHIEYMQDMRGATSDERYRDTYEFNTKYMGLPGTFRTLRVD